MKKDNQVRSKYVKDSLADIKLMEAKMEETTRKSLDALLSENIKREINNLLAESEDDGEDDYEETEVEDTAVDNGGDSEEANNTSDEEGGSFESFSDDTDGADDMGGEGDEWAEYDQFKNEDGEYDLRGADRDTVIKVYKLLSNDDEVIVTNDNGIINIKDNAKGTEYMVDTTGNAMGGDTNSAPMGDGGVDLDGEEGMGDNEFMGSDDMEGESDDMDSFEDEESEGSFDYSDDDNDDETVYEITLNDGEEIKEDLGYTTNYQKQTAMKTPGNNEPAKASQTYSMDKGVPTGTDKPYGKNNGDKTPFNKNVKEGDENKEETIEEQEEQVDEATNVGGFVQQNSNSKSHVPNSKGRGARNQSKGGEYTSTQTPRYSQAQMESIKSKAKAIFEENQAIKGVIKEMKDKLYKAAVTNKNLGQVIRLVTENTTTREEKIDIIKRFGSEAKTVEQSDALYESISKNLNKINSMSNVGRAFDRTINENSNKKDDIISETTMYQNSDLLQSINLIRRMNNL